MQYQKATTDATDTCNIEAGYRRKVPSLLSAHGDTTCQLASLSLLSREPPDHTSVRVSRANPTAKCSVYNIYNTVRCVEYSVRDFCPLLAGDLMGEGLGYPRPRNHASFITSQDW